MRILLLSLFAACASAPAPAPTPVPAPAHATERFDFKVRQDFFDGLRGDAAAMQRAMTLCEQTLAKDPNHAEAMVWHGAGLLSQAGQKFQAHDKKAGLALWQRGMGEMDHAVELQPQNVGVRIPRGAVLLAMAPFVPEAQRTPLVRRGLDDYEATLAVQKGYFSTLTLHSREQLLYGLVDGYARIGDTDKAHAYFDRMTKEAAGSELLARAKERADGHEVPGQTPCEQCHAR